MQTRLKIRIGPSVCFISGVNRNIKLGYNKKWWHIQQGIMAISRAIQARGRAPLYCFNNSVDEQLIMNRTGHRSNAVRAYTRYLVTSCVEQENLVSKILDPPPAKKGKLETTCTLSTASEVCARIF